MTEIVTIGDVSFGGGKIGFICGPCSLESYEISIKVAQTLKEIKKKLPIGIVFKGSFDKANRLRGDSPRGPGLKEGIEILKTIQEETGLPTITDIHEPYQAEVVAEVVSAIQIPAFLSRQTDLLKSACETKKPVFLKKGQFLSPEDIPYLVEKAYSFGAVGVLIGERGYTFGYGDLVVDFRGVVKMSAYAPVILDISHSLQSPGKIQGKSGGDRTFSIPLGRAGIAVGVGGIFLESHPDPSRAISDQQTQIPLSELPALLFHLYDFHRNVKIFLENSKVPL